MSATNVKRGPGEAPATGAGDLAARLAGGKAAVAAGAFARRPALRRKEAKLVVRAIVKDVATRRPVKGASYELARSAQPQSPVAKGKTEANGLVEHEVGHSGAYTLRVTEAEAQEPDGDPVKRDGRPLAEATLSARRDDRPATPKEVFVFCGKHVVAVELDIDPDDPDSHDDKVTLKTADGSFEETKTVKDDVVPGDETTTLVFEIDDPDLEYTLVVDPGEGGEPYVLSTELTASTA